MPVKRFRKSLTVSKRVQKPGLDGGRRDVPDAGQAFRNRNEGHRFLQLPAVYSLDPGLITCIIRQQGLRDFFGEADLKFEEDLSRSAEVGLINGRLVGLTDQSLGDVTPSEVAERDARIDTAIDELQTGQFKDMDSLGLKALQRRQSDRCQRQRSLQEGYRGWLICNSAYRQELSELRRQWSSEIDAAGCFPRIAHVLWPHYSLGPAFPPLLVYHFLDFYLGWGLDGMTTWELPNPMSAELAASIRRRKFTFSIADMFPGKTAVRLGPKGSQLVRQVSLELEQAGAELFLPWPTLMDGSLGLETLIDDLKFAECPVHLRTWVEKKLPDGRQSYARERFTRVAYVYRQLYLALLIRYPDKCRRRMHLLDRAIAEAGRTSLTSQRHCRFVIQRYTGTDPRFSATYRDPRVPPELSERL